MALTILGRAYRNGALRNLVASRSVRRAIASQRRTIGAAAARGDAVELFGAARKALQTRLGANWGIPCDAISTADVIARLAPGGERIREVFERADRLTYAGGGAVTHEDLEQLARTDIRRAERTGGNDMTTHSEVFPQGAATDSLDGAARTRRENASRRRPRRRPGGTRQMAAATVLVTCLGWAAGAAAHGEPPRAYSLRALVSQAQADLAGGRPGRALLAFERAQVLAPRAPAVVGGLVQARAAAGLPTREEGLAMRAAERLSPNEWSWIAMAGLGLGAAGLVVFAWGLIRRRGLFGAGFCGSGDRQLGIAGGDEGRATAERRGGDLIRRGCAHRAVRWG